LASRRRLCGVARPHHAEGGSDERQRASPDHPADVPAAACPAVSAFRFGAAAFGRADPELVADAISVTVGKLVRRGCGGSMAQEFGDHPEAAAERMRWVRQLCAQTPALVPAAR
jgi:hypothetical protein